MNQTKTILFEQVSALADGQLDDEKFGRLMADADQSGEVQAAWQRYHLIGDVLRAGRHEQCTDTSTFIARLKQNIALEPSTPVRTPIAVVSPQLLHRMKAANEPVFRWKLVSGVASMAAAVAIGWGWVGSVTAPVGAQIAQTQQLQPAANTVVALATPAGPVTRGIASPPVTVAAGTEQQPQTMLRNARLDELLAAHQQATGGLQPSVFLRNATFEGPSR
jgi:sigma-E factor negative regulatory protein RseA